MDKYILLATPGSWGDGRQGKTDRWWGYILQQDAQRYSRLSRQHDFLEARWHCRRRFQSAVELFERFQKLSQASDNWRRSLFHRITWKRHDKAVNREARNTHFQSKPSWTQRRRYARPPRRPNIQELFCCRRGSPRSGSCNASWGHAWWLPRLSLHRSRTDRERAQNWHKVIHWSQIHLWTRSCLEIPIENQRLINIIKTWNPNLLHGSWWYW